MKKQMGEHRTCRHPDRDTPKMMCGFPLPCPWHTAVIHTDRDPPTVEIPIGSDAMKSSARERIGAIARAVWERINEAADRAEDEAKAERILSRMRQEVKRRKAGVLR